MKIKELLEAKKEVITESSYNERLAKDLPARIKRAEEFIQKIADYQKDIDEAKTYLPAIQKALKEYKGKGEFQSPELTKAIQLLIFVERIM